MKCSATLKLIVVSWLFCCYTQSTAWAVSNYLPRSVADEQTTTANPESPAAVREMVSHLSDKEVRDILIMRLDLVATQQDSVTTQPSLIEFTTNTVIGIARPIKRAFVLLPQTLDSVTSLLDEIAASILPESTSKFSLLIVFAVGSGLLMFCLIRRMLSPLQNKLDLRTQNAGLIQKIGVFFARIALALLSFHAFSFVVFALLQPLLSAAAFEAANIIVRRIVLFAAAAYTFFDLLLASGAPHRRLLNFDDWHAKFIHRHATGAIALIGFTGAYFTFHDIHNFDRGSNAAGFWINLAVYLYFVFIALRGRSGFSTLLRHTDDTPRERQIANSYPYFVVSVIVFTWLLVEALASNNQFHLIKDGRHYLFMALLIWAPAMDSAIRTVVHHIQPPVMGKGLIAERAHLSTKRSYIRIGRVVLIALVLNSVMEIWDLDIVNIASAGLGSQFVLRFIDALWIALFGYLIWELTTLWINRKLAAEQTAAGLNLEDEEIGGEGGGAGSSRLSTVLPLLRWTAQTIIITTTLLLVLGQLGLDTTPLLAGAGVVGLAIGFGAQKLVSDVVSGIFFLIDDAFREGEYVEVETTVGTVEKISLRSMQLRHHRGAVHTIPFGEIPKITNFSRDWVIMKLRFTVPFDTDIHKVKKIFKKIGQEIMEVPEFAEDLIQPFKSQGVLEVDDVGMVIRGKFMAKPGKQFTLRKEIYQRVQQAFDENGLQFARKEVRVKVDGPASAQLGEDDKQAIAAAASESVENPTTPPAAT